MLNIATSCPTKLNQRGNNDEIIQIFKKFHNAMEEGHTL
jgi:hypothetical protein